ncbi:hypothetical protein FCV25MIE_15037 [Fagus crenata]
MSSSSPPSNPDSGLGKALPQKPFEFKSATAILLASKGIQRIKSSKKKYSTLGEALPQKLSELCRGVARYATSKGFSRLNHQKRETQLYWSSYLKNVLNYAKV